MRSAVVRTSLVLGMGFVLSTSNALAQVPVGGSLEPNRHTLLQAAVVEATRVGALRPTASQAAAATGKQGTWVQRHPVLLGTLIGMGAGTAMAGGMVAAGHPEGGEVGAVMFGGVLAGAAGGALVGWLVSALR